MCIYSISPWKWQRPTDLAGNANRAPLTNGRTNQFLLLAWEALPLADLGRGWVRWGSVQAQSRGVDIPEDHT